MQADKRDIAHFDLDSFFVSVERLKNSRLKNRPVAVAGSSERGVIASCSYEARRFGVKSAMPVKLARRLCPELILIKGDMDSYSSFSATVTEIIAEQVPLFEKSSIDEFYIDLTGMEAFFGCLRFIEELRNRIEKDTGLFLSYAIASNKLVSKVGTGEAKPHGRLAIPFGKERSFLAPLRIHKLPMIGEKTAHQLNQMGVDTIKTLSEIPLEMLTTLLGKNGMELWRRANGMDESPVVPWHEQKSISTETTFETDTINIHFLKAKLVRMAEQLAFELRKQNKLTGCITVKLRYSDFQTVTKQSRIAYTAADHILIEKIISIFDKLYERRLLVRLVGVKFTDLVAGSYQISLFDDTQEMIRLYQKIDSIKNQFGEDRLIRACGIA